MSDTASQKLLDIRNLSILLPEGADRRYAVEDISVDLSPGETLCIVGESGSGKSVSSYAIMRILDRNGRIANGRVMFDGMELTAFSNREMRELRGREISMVFQNPRAALNPIRKVGPQIEDVVRRQARATKNTP